jgi:hypothetical protein
LAMDPVTLLRTSRGFSDPQPCRRKKKKRLVKLKQEIFGDTHFC